MCWPVVLMCAIKQDETQYRSCCVAPAVSQPGARPIDPAKVYRFPYWSCLTRLWPEGKAHFTMYARVLRPSAVATRLLVEESPAEEASPFIIDRPFIIDSPLVMLRPLIMLKPFVLTRAALSSPTKSSPAPSWQPAANNPRATNEPPTTGLRTARNGADL